MRIHLFLGLVLLLLGRLPFAAADQQFSLVTPQWVAAHANDPTLHILDVRQDVHAYLAGHVPNAVHLPESALRGPYAGVPVQFFPAEMMATVLERAGVNQGDQVVLYSDGEDVTGATMVAYVLDRLSHAPVAIMDGGWAAYSAAQKISQQYQSYRVGRVPTRENRAVRVGLEEVRDAIRGRQVTFVDARPIKAYSGQADTWMRNGHIPLARNADWHSLVQPNNPHQFKPLPELQAYFSRRGIEKTDDIVVYCGTGREATLDYFVLKHLLGYPKVRLYEGSWIEYAAHPGMPVETGDRPGGTTAAEGRKN